jgi:hypothetical protein
MTTCRLFLNYCFPFRTLTSGGEQNAGRQRLLRALAEAGIEPTLNRNWRSSDAPYPGLEAFREEDAAVFLGREPDVHRAVDMLRTARREGLLLVLGASGCEKSSLGWCIPVLPALWQLQCCSVHGSRALDLRFGAPALRDVFQPPAARLDAVKEQHRGGQGDGNGGGQGGTRYAGRTGEQ